MKTVSEGAGKKKRRKKRKRAKTSTDDGIVHVHTVSKMMIDGFNNSAHEISKKKKKNLILV